MPFMVIPFPLSPSGKVNTTERWERQAVGSMAALMPRQLIQGTRRARVLFFSPKPMASSCSTAASQRDKAIWICTVQFIINGGPTRDNRQGEGTIVHEKPSYIWDLWIHRIHKLFLCSLQHPAQYLSWTICSAIQPEATSGLCWGLTFLIRSTYF